MRSRRMQACSLRSRLRGSGACAIVARMDQPPPGSTELLLADAAATLALGRRLGAALRPGDVLYLEGGLGMGKTTFARGVIAAWTGEAQPDAPSPTFTLVQTYEGASGVLTHADLYRLDIPEETLELGLDEAVQDGALLVEWPERLGRFFNPNAARLRFLEPPGEQPGRVLRLANAPHLQALAQDFRFP